MTPPPCPPLIRRCPASARPVAAARAPGLALGLGLALALAGAASAATVTVQAQGAGGKPLADAVLLLEPLAARAVTKPATGVEIVQKDKQFVPAVTVVPVGTRVAFPNQDTVRHHVYSFSEARKFELKLYAGRPENPVLFDRAGVVVLGCNIHDQMVGWIIVSDTPWYGKSPASGRVVLTEVPPGHYRLRAWHPDLPPGSPGLEQAVVVGAADAAAVVKLPGGAGG
jgi:plastocyanin